MQQQTATYPPLTEEQEGLLKILQTEGKTSQQPWLYIAIGTVKLLTFWWLMPLPLKGLDSIPYFLTLFLSIMWISLGWYLINKRKNLEIDIAAFFGCQNPQAAGILTKATVIGKDKHRPECIATLIPLLYSMTDGEAFSAFNDEEKQMLRDIASKPYWRKHEPDLVAAAIVGLSKLDDERSIAALQRLAGKTWDKEERWVGQAAKMCLEDPKTKII
jgi:hypothetical protein